MINPSAQSRLSFAMAYYMFEIPNLKFNPYKELQFSQVRLLKQIHIQAKQKTNSKARKPANTVFIDNKFILIYN